jgi:hypothetical protein
MKNSRNKQLLSFKLYASQSSVVKFQASLLCPTMNHPLSSASMLHMLPTPYSIIIAAVSTITSTALPFQFLAPALHTVMLLYFNISYYY